MRIGWSDCKDEGGRREIEPVGKTPLHELEAIAQARHIGWDTVEQTLVTNVAWARLRGQIRGPSVIRNAFHGAGRSCMLQDTVFDGQRFGWVFETTHQPLS